MPSGSWRRISPSCAMIFHRDTERKAPVCASRRSNWSNVSSQICIEDDPSVTSARSSARSNGWVNTVISRPASAVASTVASMSTVRLCPGARICLRRRRALGRASESRIGRGEPSPISVAGNCSPSPVGSPPRRSGTGLSWLAVIGPAASVSDCSDACASGPSSRSEASSSLVTVTAAISPMGWIADSHSTSMISSAVSSEPITRSWTSLSIKCRSILEEGSSPVACATRRQAGIHQ